VYKVDYSIRLVGKKGREKGRKKGKGKGKKGKGKILV